MSSDKLLGINDLPDPHELISADHLPDPQELASSAPVEPGRIEALLRGGAQGLTFGTADEITAGLESALSDKTYQDALKESRSNYKSAEDAHPGYTLAGNLVGGIGGGAALGAVAAPLEGLSLLKGLTGAGEAAGTLAKLKRAAALGAGYGALTSAGTSENSVVDKPLAFAGDVATGAGVGGVGGAGLSALGSTGAKVLNKLNDVGVIGDMTRSFNVGRNGTSYFLPKDVEALENKATVAASSTRDAINDKLAKLSQAKQSILQQATSEGKTVDVTPLFNDAMQRVDALTTDEITGGDKRKLESILKAIPADLDYGNIGPDKVDSIKRMFSQYTKLGDNSLQTPEARKIALDMVKQLDQKVMNSIGDPTTEAALSNLKDDTTQEVSKYLANMKANPDTANNTSIKNLNKGISDLLTTQEVLKQGNTGSQADKINEVQKLRSMLGRTASEGDSGTTARQTIEQTKKVLQNVAPEIADETIGKAQNLADDLYLKKLAKGQTHGGLATLFGVGNVATVGGANLAGSLYGSAESLLTPGSTAFRALSAAANKNGDTAFGTMLDKIANTTDDNRRKAMVNTLMQTPYYRQKLEEAKTKIKGVLGDNDGSEN